MALEDHTTLPEVRVFKYEQKLMRDVLAVLSDPNTSDRARELLKDAFVDWGKAALQNCEFRRQFLTPEILGAMLVLMNKLTRKDWEARKSSYRFINIYRRIEHGVSLDDLAVQEELEDEPDEEPEEEPEPQSGPPRVRWFKVLRDIPAVDLRKGDFVTVEEGAEVKHGELAIVVVGDRTRTDRIYYPGPHYIRIGEDADDIERASDVKIIGPVVEIKRKERPAEDELEWPTLIMA